MHLFQPAVAESGALDVVTAGAAVVAAVSALLATIGGLTNQARLRRHISQVQAWLEIEADPGRRSTLEGIHLKRSGDLFSKQMTPLSRVLAPLVLFLVPIMHGSSEAYGVLVYILRRREPPVNWDFLFWPNAWVAGTFTLLNLSIGVISFLALREVLFMRVRMTGDYYYGRPVAEPALFPCPFYRHTLGTGRTAGVWLAALTASLAAFALGFVVNLWYKASVDQALFTDDEQIMIVFTILGASVLVLLLSTMSVAYLLAEVHEGRVAVLNASWRLERQVLVVAKHWTPRSSKRHQG